MCNFFAIEIHAYFGNVLAESLQVVTLARKVSLSDDYSMPFNMNHSVLTRRSNHSILHTRGKPSSAMMLLSGTSIGGSF